MTKRAIREIARSEAAARSANASASDAAVTTDAAAAAAAAAAGVHRVDGVSAAAATHAT